MGEFCDRLKFGSTAAPDCRTGQNKGRYREKELLLLLVSLVLKSDNLQYNTLSCWVDCFINQASDGPSIILID